jgi:hypothetical protein
MSETAPATDYSRYRLTVKGKRGLRLRPLSFRPKPDAIPGESLKGLVARAAVRNGFRSLTKVDRNHTRSAEYAVWGGRTACVLPQGT